LNSVFPSISELFAARSPCLDDAPALRGPLLATIEIQVTPAAPRSFQRTIALSRLTFGGCKNAI
jgi:hypothetical protein